MEEIANLETKATDDDPTLELLEKAFVMQSDASVSLALL